MYKDRILKLLRANDGFLSGEELACEDGHLAHHGLEAYQDPWSGRGSGSKRCRSRGYRITSSPDLLRVDDIKSGLRTKTVGKSIHLLPRPAPRTPLPWRWHRPVRPEGTVVIAETQTAGKGRLGRKWISPKGNLYLSVVFRPALPVHKAPLITLMGAVAAASAIRSACGLPASIKWPNDIQLSGRKAGGLLTEMSAEPDRIRHIVLGIGLDVNMDRRMPCLPTSASISYDAGGRSGQKHRPDRASPAPAPGTRSVVRGFPGRRCPAVLKEWRTLNSTLGSRVSVSGARRGLRGRGPERSTAKAGWWSGLMTARSGRLRQAMSRSVKK